MRSITLLAFVLLINVSGPAFPNDKAMAQTKMPSNVDNARLEKLSADSEAAIATVDRFNHAIAAGDIERAGAELDANVLILESGSAEHSAAEYLAGHAKEDATFLKNAQVRIIRRTSQTSGYMVWVATESEIRIQNEGHEVTILATETMTLMHIGRDWKITHIHWSSHKNK